MAHSQRTGRLGPVPACVRPLPVGLDAGNEAKWAPVEVGRSESKKWGEYGGKQEACEIRVMFEKATENLRQLLNIMIKREKTEMGKNIKAQRRFVRKKCQRQSLKQHREDKGKRREKSISKKNE